MFHVTDRVLFGAAYYHEYQSTPRLDEDLDLMQAAGFSVIRVGESVWSTWEPENGVFELDWLQPVLDGAHARGIGVILGTPTYAAPLWLARQNPEINVERSTGQRMGWGARQEIDFSNPAFLFHAERVIRKIIARYADHPAVIGFQVDNEPGNELFHNHGVFQRFVDQLRARYGSVEALNREWGLSYWSHRLSTWADLWRPDMNAQPQYALAWRRFQAQLTTEFIGWQAALVREYASAGQFVTTCISYERRTMQDEELTRHLDVTSGNPYYRMQESLALPATVEAAQGWTTTGTWALYATADRMFASKQAPFLVTETNAQAIGMSWQNEPAYDGQWRQAAWALVSRGATMIEYWHWNTLHAGAETYWGGVLPHSGEPGRAYEQIAQLGREFATAGALTANLTPDAGMTFVFSNPSKWSLEETPQLGGYGSEAGDRRSFQTIFDAFYRGAFEAGVQAGIMHPTQLLEREPGDAAQTLPVLVAAGVTIADDALLDWLERYAEAGGHLVLGIRTGSEDEEARARAERKPARLDRAAGVWFDEFSTIDTPVGLSSADPSFTLAPGSQATRWIDGLNTTDATALVAYEHPHFGRWPAVTTRRHGAGRVTTVGTVPDRALARSLAEWVAGVSRLDDGWARQTESQTVTAATAASGARLRFIHNWSWAPSEYRLPGAVRDALRASEHAAGESILLGSWDVRVLIEDEGREATPAR